MAKAYMKTPCENCPYRVDAPRRLWDKKEFEGVLAAEADPIGRVYACHKQAEIPNEERGFCAGWLLDQKKRGIPSIALRIVLSTEAGAVEALNAVTAAGLQLFSTVKAMCRANGVRPKPGSSKNPWFAYGDRAYRTKRERVQADRDEHEARNKW